MATDYGLNVRTLRAFKNRFCDAFDRVFIFGFLEYDFSIAMDDGFPCVCLDDDDVWCGDDGGEVDAYRVEVERPWLHKFCAQAAFVGARLDGEHKEAGNVGDNKLGGILDFQSTYPR